MAGIAKEVTRLPQVATVSAQGYSFIGWIGG